MSNVSFKNDNKEVVAEPFTYDILDEKTRPVVQKHTERIKVLVKQSHQNAVQLGSKLIEIKRLLTHGSWLPWHRQQFNASAQTAENFMNHAKRCGVYRDENPKALEFVSQEALYLISRS